MTSSSTTSFTTVVGSLRQLGVVLCSAGVVLSGTGCLTQSYEVSGAELQRIVALPAEERGDRLRVTQQTLMGSDLTEAERAHPGGGVVLTFDDDPYYHHYHHDHYRHRNSLWASNSYDESDSDGREADTDDDAEEALAAAMVVVAVAATAAVTVGVTEGARFDGWVHARPDHPVLLVDNMGGHEWTRLDALTPAGLSGVERAVLPDVRDSLKELDRHPLDRAGFAYQLEFGAESAPFDGSELAASARGAVGFMPMQRFGILFGGAFSSARNDVRQSGELQSTALHVDYRMFLQLEAWPLDIGPFHLGPYGEVGYAWAMVDDSLGSREVEGSMFALGAAMQFDWTTRLALTLRAGAAWLPTVGTSFSREPDGYRVAPSVTLGVSIY